MSDGARSGSGLPPLAWVLIAAVVLIALGFIVDRLRVRARSKT